MEQIVGFIGLGLMGKHMARNLLKAGCRLLVHNRSRTAVDELVGERAEEAWSPAGVLTTCGGLDQSFPGICFYLP